jgi:hypothetical protein
VIADARGIAHVAQARFMGSGGSPEGSYTDQRGPECCGSFWEAQRSYRQVDSANWDSS